MGTYSSAADVGNLLNLPETIGTGILNNQTKNAMQGVDQQNFDIQQLFAQIAQKVFQGSLAQSGTAAYDKDLGAAKQNYQQNYQSLEASPTSLSKPTGSQASGRVQKNVEGNQALTNTAQAGNQAYSQVNTNQQIQQMLARAREGQISQEAFNYQQAEPLELRQAQTSTNDSLRNALGWYGGATSGVASAAGGMADGLYGGGKGGGAAATL